MKYVEIVAASTSTDTLIEIARLAKALDLRLGVVGDDGQRQVRMLIGNARLQWVLDTLQNVLGAQPSARVVVLEVEAALPRLDDAEEQQEDSAVTAREELYTQIKSQALLNWNYVVLVMLSTIVVTIGMIENNVAVVIGAMVIAPLLGPNLALSFGTALADMSLIRRALTTLSVGLLICISISVPVGLYWPHGCENPEVLSRTKPELDSIVLALASGAAAALSLTTGVASALVGVMVAVALLPPAVTIGLMLGNGAWPNALGAALLLSINIVCVNLSSKIVFLARRIHPHGWLEKEKAKRVMAIYLLIWILTLALLAFLVVNQPYLPAN